MFDDILKLNDWSSWQTAAASHHTTGSDSNLGINLHDQHHSFWDVSHHPDHFAHAHGVASVGNHWDTTGVMHDYSQSYTLGADSSFYGNVIGHPAEDAQFWHEQASNTSCAVVSQLSILESITHTHLSEDAVCKIAQDNHWYDPDSGTKPDDIGKILNAFGVPTDHKHDATLQDLADALNKGDKVIVGVNANDIWHPVKDPVTGEPLPQEIAGHAVWVTGIEQEPSGSVKIILNDSGTPNGCMETVDATDFLNAWRDCGQDMIVAHTPSQVATA
ncbi:MAG: hypothetical protein DSM106950_26835 [Stigonema ocellatum SAG 48.90 = DSM 106950]|nr:hypothetical protein [Stigonema ocellatum SAG 48.90 = DSM 106950]